MKQFNINDYQGKYAMHCKTEEEAKDFCRVLHEAGRVWCDGKSYLGTTRWGSRTENTVYHFNEGQSGTLYYAQVNDYTILNWSDFMQHEFTKADLRDGMVGIDREGCKYIYLNKFFMDANGSQLLCYDEDLRDDLTVKTDSGNELDIMRVCESKSETLEEYFDDANLIVIWQRPEATVMTMDEIKKALGIEGELIIKEV